MFDCLPPSASAAAPLQDLRAGAASHYSTLDSAERLSVIATSLYMRERHLEQPSAEYTSPRCSTGVTRASSGRFRSPFLKFSLLRPLYLLPHPPFGVSPQAWLPHVRSCWSKSSEQGWNSISMPGREVSPDIRIITAITIGYGSSILEACESIL